MGRVVVTSTIGDDGILHLKLPIGQTEAGKEVQVTVEPVRARKRSVEEWRRAILETAGTWEGEFERPDQGELQERDPLS